MAEGTPRLGVRVPEALLRAVKSQAVERGISLQDLIVGFLREWVEPDRLERMERALQKEKETVQAKAARARAGRQETR
ncbi:MAG TPA: hypothetical protein GXX55_03585 [Firmicutes bacterium]|nr:hypothetical protein [Bacillota bacterium]